MGVGDKRAGKLPIGIQDGEYAESYLSGYNLCDRWHLRTAITYLMVNLLGECFANGYVDGHANKVCDQSARSAIFNEALRAGHMIGQSIRAAKAHS
jgi:hypothetical protein